MSMKFKMKNWKLALEAMENTPSKEFNMQHYYYFDNEKNRDWIDSESFLDADSWSVIKRFKDAPCGTVSCLAGTIHWNFAEGRNWDIFPKNFAEKFLGLDHESSEKLFCSASTYGKERLVLVTKTDVINKLKFIISEGSFKNAI